MPEVSKACSRTGVSTGDADAFPVPVNPPLERYAPVWFVVPKLVQGKELPRVNFVRDS